MTAHYTLYLRLDDHSMRLSLKWFAGQQYQIGLRNQSGIAVRVGVRSDFELIAMSASPCETTLTSEVCYRSHTCEPGGGLFLIRHVNSASEWRV